MSGRRAALILAALFLMCFFWTVSFASARSLGDEIVSLALDAPLAGDGARELRRAEGLAERPVPFAVWRQWDRRTLEAEGLVSTARADVVEADGDTGLLLPVGVGLAEGDRSGCLIDDATAYALFGHAGAVGGTVRWRDRDYVVRGTFSSPASTLVVRPRQIASFAPDRVTLGASGAASPRSEAEAFCLRHGLTAASAVYYGGFSTAAGLFARLPLAAMGALVCARLWLRARRSRPEPVLRALWLLALLAAALAALWAGELPLSFPQELVPTRWSDFAFWQRLWQARREELFAFLWMKKARPDVLLLGRLARAIGSGLAALACFLSLRGLPERAAHPGFWLAAGPGCAFLALWAAQRLGVPAVPARMFWLAFPFWLYASLLESGRAGRPLRAPGGLESTPAA